MNAPAKTKTNPDLMALFDAYRSHCGVHAGPEAAASLTLAHCVMEMRKTFIVTEYIPTHQPQQTSEPVSEYQREANRG